jgi:hypothetical protein
VTENPIVYHDILLEGHLSEVRYGLFPLCKLSTQVEILKRVNGAKGNLFNICC